MIRNTRRFFARFQVFSCPANLASHRRWHRPRNADHTSGCPTCPLRFETKKQLREHKCPSRVSAAGRVSAASSLSSSSSTAPPPPPPSQLTTQPRATSVDAAAVAVANNDSNCASPLFDETRDHEHETSPHAATAAASQRPALISLGLAAGSLDMRTAMAS